MLLQKKNTSFRIGLTIAVIMAALALIGYVWTPYDPVAIAGSQKFLPPSLRHLFGTDNFGRDIFSRVMAGMGTTFFISLCTVAIGAVIYYAVIQLVLQMGLNTNDLKLLSAAIVAVFLAVPHLKGKLTHKGGTVHA